jgi:hypothetical protein
MSSTTTKAFGALAAIALSTTGMAFAQKPVLSTKDPVKTQTRLKTEPLKADIKAPGTAKVTVRRKK